MGIIIADIKSMANVAVTGLVHFIFVVKVVECLIFIILLLLLFILLSFLFLLSSTFCTWKTIIDTYILIYLTILCN